MSRLVVHPVERLGRVVVDGVDAPGSLRTVFVSRWSTDVLGCEVWCVLSTVELGEGRSVARREWYTTPAAACAAAVRRFTTAGYGLAPFAPSTLIRRPIAPTGFVLADEVRP